MNSNIVTRLTAPTAPTQATQTSVHSQKNQQKCVDSPKQNPSIPNSKFSIFSGPKSSGFETMQSAYLKGSRSGNLKNLSSFQKSSPAPKKEISDSNIKGGLSKDFEDSCIVQEDSINENEENMKNTANVIGKVGMSSKMSCQVRSNTNLDHVSKPSNMSSSLFFDQSRDNFVSKTMDLRQGGSKCSFTNHMARMSCMTSNQVRDPKAGIPNLASTFKPSQKLLASPDFPKHLGTASEENFHTFAYQEQIYKEIPGAEGSTTFMKTTSKNQELTPVLRSIPNEISVESSQEIQIIRNNTSLGKGLKKQKNHTVNKRPKTSQLEINVFQLNEKVDQALDKHFYYENEKFQHFTMQEHSSKTEIEQNIFQQMNEDYNNKEIIQSNFNSNNTVKQIDFYGNQAEEKNSQISSSQLSKIRHELQFPTIEMNKIKYMGQNQFFFAGSNSSDNDPQQNSPQSIVKEKIRQISLQPSLSSKTHSKIASNCENNSVLQDMCQELSDIKKEKTIDLSETRLSQPQENIQSYLFDIQGSQGGQCEYYQVPVIIPSHHKKKSSLLNLVEGPYNPKNNPLENSAVTFQYYNSNKFASNQTVKDVNKAQAANCFYNTKTTNQSNPSNYNSKESAAQYKHTRVQDLILNDDDLEDPYEQEVIQEQSEYDSSDQPALEGYQHDVKNFDKERLSNINRDLHSQTQFAQNSKHFTQSKLQGSSDFSSRLLEPYNDRHFTQIQPASVRSSKISDSADQSYTILQAASISANKQLKTISSGNNVQPLTTVNSNNYSSQKTDTIQMPEIKSDDMKIIQYSRQSSSQNNSQVMMNNICEKLNTLNALCGNQEPLEQKTDKEIQDQIKTLTLSISKIKNRDELEEFKIQEQRSRNEMGPLGNNTERLGELAGGTLTSNRSGGSSKWQNQFRSRSRSGIKSQISQCQPSEPQVSTKFKKCKSVQKLRKPENGMNFKQSEVSSHLSFKTCTQKTYNTPLSIQNQGKIQKTLTITGVHVVKSNNKSSQKNKKVKK